jgi:inner membrane protein
MRRLMYKIVTAGVLMAVLLVALGAIRGLVSERQQLRDQVVQDIARSSSYQQQLTGPILVVPYRRVMHEWQKQEGSAERVQKEHTVSGQLTFLPETFKLDGEIKTELRSRGIYQARLYHANNKLSGVFEVPAQYGIATDLADYTFEQPYLAIGISDIRGIENALSLQLNGQRLTFNPGARLDLLGAGVHAPITVGVSNAPARLEFALDLRLQGTGQFNVTPVGRDTQVTLRSDWPHPSFVGEYLPAERSITDQGFSAQWQTSFFATNLEEILSKCRDQAECAALKERHFGVSFVDPVDQYLKSERAIKYALLFIALTFAGFFLFEVLKQLQVHAIQYGLVGLALAMFYLLLISLSEHLGFALAYGLSASACVALLTYYIGHVLQHLTRGLGFGAGLALLYALLYGLLSAEDYALLMGSLLVFALLGAVMVLTRKVDWFNLGERAA